MKQDAPFSARRLRRVLCPVMAILVALAVTVNCGMLSNVSTLNDMFGRGTRTIVAVDPGADQEAIYYQQLWSSKAESLAAATTVARQISDEGIVLLKNDALLPLSSSTTLSPFGLGYCRPFYGGSGSSAIDTGEDRVISPGEGLRSAGFRVNAVLEECQSHALDAALPLAEQDGLLAARPVSGGEEDHTLYEFAPSVYEPAASSCAGTVGVVFLSRQTGENMDASSSLYDDGTPHMLAVTAAEKQLISFAKAHCAGMVVVLCSAAPMEVAELEEDEGISAILWIGGAGSTGYASLGDILAGNVVPSGRLGDTWPTNFKAAPTFANQDDGSDRFVYQNAVTTLVTSDTWEEEAPTPFREYEEGVYLGYRYYETAYDIGALQDYNDPNSGVLYPFGYGLSYTSFSQELRSLTVRGETVRAVVRVTNTGTQYAGKEVVQLYMTAPYTQLDRDLGVEKPTAVLLQFGKTGLLPPGAWEDVTLTFSLEDMASYCYTRDNGDGTTGCYMLEAGEYVISVRADSHRVLDSETVRVGSTIWYDNSVPRSSEQEAQELAGVAGNACLAATNQFEQLNTYMTDPSVSGATILSRSDWAGTQPTAPTDRDRTASDTVVEWVAQSDSTKFDAQSDPLLGNVPGSAVYCPAAPVTGAETGLVLADLRGRDYADPMWTLLLDQLTLDDPEELRLLLFQDAYQTGALSAIGKPESVERDGPQGLTFPDQSGHNWISQVCGYPAAPVMAATWNTQLLYDFGFAVGQEALLAGINGWYAPGLNLHRSPFGGRVSEYFSEDPLLTGLLGAQVLSGAGDAGLYCSVKHLGLMDTEAHRNPHTAVWLTEQALRELYLRPFELALKTARKTVVFLDEEDGSYRERVMSAGDFIMASDSAIGTEWSAANYALLTQVVRGEWGFRGFILSDIHLNGNGNQADKLLRAGCDALLSTSYGVRQLPEDLTSPTAQHLIRRSVKNLCYTLVNSNLMQGASPGSLVRLTPAPWRLCLLAADGAVAVLVAAMGALVAVRSWQERPRRRRP